jgi:DNA-binding NtrC family response regulator
MPLDLQPKLLRVLQQLEVTPVGSAMPVNVDVQVVAATNRDLEREVAEGRFREDLYYRLNMVEFHVPPLRHRVDDIPHFVEYFSRKFSARYGRPLWRANSETLRQFCEYRWPGNIRQLANVIEQAYVLDCEPRVPERAVSHRITDASLPFMDLAQLRRAAVQQALRATQGHKSHAARLLGVHPNTMTRLLAQLRGEEPRDPAE